MKTIIRNVALLGLSTACLVANPCHAQTVVWSENFDSGNPYNRWYADNGLWQIGSPTYGPPMANGCRAHSCPNCATTGLTTNYPSGTDSRLISRPSLQITIPPSNQFPRLRFWHWYNFSSSHGKVEVMGTNGTWYAVSPSYTGFSGDWTYTSVDLSAFAGQMVQIAFHLIPDCCGGSAPGWYIDDVELLAGAPVFNNPESWEGGIGDWYAETGTWQVGVATKAGGPPVDAQGFQDHTGSNCAVTLLNANYPSGADSRLVSPPIVIPPASEFPGLQFWHWFNWSSSYGQVEVKGTNGTWQPVPDAVYTGSSAGWTPGFGDLRSYAGQMVQIAFHMIPQCCGGSAQGWYVDDISIQTAGAPVLESVPSSQAACVGAFVSLDVTASGDTPLGYQWRFNSNSITGATNATLVLPNIQLSQAGYYEVLITNDAGSTNSSPALVTVEECFVGVPIQPTNTTSGSVTNSNGSWTVAGGGTGIGATADAFYYVCQPLSGDSQIIARVTSVQGGQPGAAEAGIMIRGGLGADAVHAALTVNSLTNVVFKRRLGTAGPWSDQTIQTPFNGTNCNWLSLMRLGNTLVAHCSSDGLKWEYVWFTTINMPDPIQIGLAVSADNYALVATGVLDHVTVGTPSLLPPWPLSHSQIFLGGESDAMYEFQRVGGFKMLVGSGTGDILALKTVTSPTEPFVPWQTYATKTNNEGFSVFLDSRALTNAPQYYRVQKIGP